MLSSASNQISLEQLRALIESEPPVGTEVARACRFDALELARLCGCSLRQLQRVFGDSCRTPDRWLFEHRMLCALATLEHLDASGELKSIKSFAMALGYHHPEHFYRLFKRMFGLTPTEFLAERQKALRLLGIAPENLLGKLRPHPIITSCCRFLLVLGPGNAFLSSKNAPRR